MKTIFYIKQTPRCQSIEESRVLAQLYFLGTNTCRSRRTGGIDHTETSPLVGRDHARDDAALSVDRIQTDHQGPGVAVRHLPDRLHVRGESRIIGILQNDCPELARSERESRSNRNGVEAERVLRRRRLKGRTQRAARIRERTGDRHDSRVEAPFGRVRGRTEIGNTPRTRCSGNLSSQSRCRRRIVGKQRSCEACTGSIDGRIYERQKTGIGSTWSISQIEYFGCQSLYPSMNNPGRDGLGQYNLSYPPSKDN